MLDLKSEEATLGMSEANRGVSAQVVGLAPPPPGSPPRGAPSELWLLRVATPNDAFELRRRFRQFDALHASLKQSYTGLPELPSKGALSIDKRGDFLEKRRAGLNAYLQGLLADPLLACADDVRTFLELGSAAQLFERLTEKERSHALLLLEKDRELAKQRRSIVTLTTDLAEATQTADQLQSQLKEAMQERAAVRESDEALLLARQRTTTLEEALTKEHEKTLGVLETLTLAEAERDQLRTDKCALVLSLDSLKAQIEEEARRLAATEDAASAAEANASKHAKRAAEANDELYIARAALAQAEAAVAEWRSAAERAEAATATAASAAREEAATLFHSSAKEEQAEPSAGASDTNAALEGDHLRAQVAQLKAELAEATSGIRMATGRASELDARLTLTAADAEAARAQLAQARTKLAARATADHDLTSVSSAIGSPRATLLPSPAQALGSLQTAVVAASSSDASRWTFRVRVSSGGFSFEITRRYRQFKALHAALRGVVDTVSRLPALPPKLSYRRQSERFAEDRRRALDEYLRFVVADRELRACAELGSFLELGMLIGREDDDALSQPRGIGVGDTTRHTVF